ncbi:protein-export chaperone SecB [Marinobacterium aestuariivivens]|uniref:Protein-export protein SecB n=1 Tax=Marinobacterium aestuariivivens TaxID=1698799 RepID=A0ABW2A122_9GAMM
MADENAQNSNQQASGPQFSVQRIYLKDASLEAPGTPTVFTKQWKPEINLDLNTRTKTLGESHYEVVLTLTVTAKVEEETAFLIEVQQAGIFQIAGLGEAELNHTLGAFCPNILFPYARESVDSLATKGSFPALMLAPVNFEALYAQRMQQQAAQQAEGESQAH